MTHQLPGPAKRRRLTNTNPEFEPNADAFRQMQLRTVIRENHLSPISNVAFNNTIISGAMNCNNLVASIGSNQLNIYDNVHCNKNFLDLFMNYVHKIPKENLDQVQEGEERYLPGATLSCLTWVYKPDPENTNLAVGTQAGDIIILSLASSSATCVLKGHTGEITHVVPVQVNSATNEQGLLSSSRDGLIKLWNTTTGRCISTYNAVDGGLASGCESICIVIESDTTFLTSQPDGSIRRWTLNDQNFNQPMDIDTAVSSSSSSSTSSSSSSSTSSTSKTKKNTKKSTNSAKQHNLDESTFVLSAPKPRPLSHFCASENGSLITGTNNGRVSVWEKTNEDATTDATSEYKCITTFSVSRGDPETLLKKKKLSASTSAASPRYGSGSRNYSVATSNEFVVTGNEGGEVIVFNGRTGSQISKLTHSRMNARSGNIENVDVSLDGTTILVSTSSGLLFRWSSLAVWEGEKGEKEKLVPAKLIA